MNVSERAASYLNIKPRTKQQLIRYLRDKGYQDAEIMDTVETLEEYHFIDDYKYCQMYFELGFEKGRGIGRIKRELSEKGVEREIIERAFEEMEYVPDQRELALEAAERVISGMSSEELAEMSWDEKRKLQARICRRLAGRGFPADIVYSVARQLVE